MMKEIPRNEIDPERALEIIEVDGTFLMDLVETAKTRAEALSILLNTARSYAGCLSAISDADNKLVDALRIGSSAARSMFALACRDNGDVEVEINKLHVKLPATGPTSCTHASAWRSGWWMSHIIDDQSAIRQLASTSTDVLRRSSTRAAECQYLFVDALKAIESRAADWGTRLQKAIDATDPDRFEFSDIDFILDILVPEMELLFHFATGEQEKFQETLEFALRRHKKYWSNPEFGFEPKGFIALGPLAIARMAFKAGFPIEVKSDYLPKSLIEWNP